MKSDNDRFVPGDIITSRMGFCCFLTAERGRTSTTNPPIRELLSCDIGLIIACIDDSLLVMLLKPLRLCWLWLPSQGAKIMKISNMKYRI